MSTPKIIAGIFALVSSGNCTKSWMLDGEDIQARADAALDPYWGTQATVYERGVKGYAIDIGTGRFGDIYLTQEAAGRAIDPTYQAAMDEAKRRSGADWA